MDTHVNSGGIRPTLKQVKYQMCLTAFCCQKQVQAHFCLHAPVAQLSLDVADLRRTHSLPLRLTRLPLA